MTIPNEEAFDFQKYRIKNQDQIELPKEIKTEDNQPFDFEKYKQKEEPTFLQETGRHLARTGSRVAETILGIPGDIVSFVKGLSESLPKLPESLRGKQSPIGEKIREGLEQLPTSQKLKEFSEEKSGGYTSPQNEYEQLGDEVTSLASLLVNPKDPLKIKSLLSSIGKSALSIGAGKTAEAYGAGETGKNTAELGTLFLTGLVGKKTADKFVSEKYQSAKSKIRPGDTVQTNQLMNGLAQVEQELNKGISTPTKAEVLKPLKELQEKAKSGTIPAEDIIQSFHDINEKLSSKKLFDELSRPEKRSLKKRYDLLKNEVNDTIKRYGRSNPEFYKEWKDANAAYATIANSKKVSNFIESKLGVMPKHLLGTVAFEAVMGYPKVAAGTIAAAGGVKTGELLYRISKNPTLRKHYLDVLQSAASENLPAVVKNMNAFNKEYEKSTYQDESNHRVALP